ncbi:FkbM family methyltransferase [Rhodoblastus acidophilus]|uniref:FkbM family methyltransferase n=1 Tax=Rhodoblastus acidophilus TaxID=1074 RepID=A0A6N8DJW9_RHOAC|nr:FkbM family methyltransferase [Rhodoblastus acidophilus]MCW2272609.1 FkbM family methyltransferase [Rhodoblastus acidophilus]MTV29521.1 FkbM family methyltransferase [Rhodoblastus acidophilus]
MNNFHDMSNHIALQTWQPYILQQTNEELELRINRLKSICDPASSAEIDCYTQRIRCHPPLKHRRQFKIDYRTIAEQTRSEWARNECAKRPRIDAQAMKVLFDLSHVEIPDNMIRPEVFYYHCGMSFVPRAKELISDRAVIDGGAYRGESAVVLHKLFPESSVYAFEPDPYNFNVLCQVAASTRFGKGVNPVNRGLADTSYRVESIRGGHGTKLIRSVAASQTALEVMSIDEHVAATGISVGLIKMDIEGLETLAVKGALETLRTQRPILSIAIYHNPVDFLELAPYIASLDLGYTLMVRHLHPQLTSFFGEFNLIAVPQ